MTTKYVSGRVKELKVGISNYSEDKSSLTVIGNVGIGTDTPTDIVGSGNTAVLAAGIVTAYRIYSTLYGQFQGGSVTADRVVGSALSVSGISTLGGSVGLGSNLNVAGVSTFVGLSTFSGDLYADNISVASSITATRIYSTLYGEFTGSSVVATNVVGSALSVSGISTLGTVQISSGIVTAISGVVTYYGDGQYLSGTGVPGISTTGTSTFENIVVNANAGIGSLNVTGVSTFVGIGTFEDKLYADQLSVSGLSTFVGNINANGSVNTVNNLLQVSGNTTLGDDENDQIDPRGQFVRALIPSGSSGTQSLGRKDKRWDVYAQALTVAGITTLGITSATDLEAEKLNVSGITTVGFITATNVYVSSGSTFSGGVDFQGENGTLHWTVKSSGSIEPGISLFFNIGDTDKQVNSIYTQNLIASGNITANGNIVGDNATNISGINSVTSTTFHGSGASLTSITNSNLSGSAGITNANLANSTVSYGGISLSLGGTDATPAFNLTDATNYPYTSLTGVATHIIGDTTPQLGGNLDGNSKSIFGVGVLTATTFSGSGASLNTLNASELDSGTVPDARFPATLPAASGVNLTALNATNLGSGTVPDARFPAILPAISGQNLTNLPTGINTEGTSVFETITVHGNAGIGSLNVTGITTLAGEIYLGSGGGDDINVNGNFISGLVPKNNDTYDLGTSGKYWRNVYISDSVVTNQMNLSGVSTFGGNINANGNIVGDSATNITGIAGVTASTLTGTLQTAAQTNITSVGTLTSLDVTGNVSIGGTLTYDDVTNIDSVGVITAREGIRVGAGKSIGSDGAAVVYYGDGSNLTGTGINTEGTSVFETITVNANAGIGSLNVTGVSTFTGNITANGNIVGDNATNISGINSVTSTTFYGDGSNLTGTGINTEGTSVFETITVNANAGIGSLNVTGVSTFGGTVEVNGNITANGYSYLYGNVDLGDTTGDTITATGRFDSDLIPTSNTDYSLGQVDRIWLTLFARQLNITGVSTFADYVGLSTGLTVAGVTTFNNNVKLLDNDKLMLGTGEDLQIYHNSSNNNSYITESGNGSFFIQGSDLYLTDEDGTNMLYAANNAGVNLYHSGSTKIQTTSTGVIITGIATATDFDSTSDIRLKTNIQPIEDPLAKVIQIEGVSFNWKADNRPAFGVIADQVQKIIPELVHGDDPKTVNYNGLIGLLIEAVKEQQIQIDELKSKLS